MSNQIEIKIDARRLTPEKYLEGVEEFVAIVHGVRKNLGAAPIEWAVEVEKGSSIFRMKDDSQAPQSRETINVVCDGFRALRNGIRTMPPGFSKREVEAARAIAELIDGDSVLAIHLKNGGTPEEIPHTVVSVANAILVRESHDAFGSVEGKIVSLSERQGFICVIYDPIERREITCYLQKAELRGEAIRGFEKNVRVLAGGLIHYAKEGHPVNITVDSIRLFPADSELPSSEDIQGIYRLYR